MKITCPHCGEECFVMPDEEGVPVGISSRVREVCQSCRESYTVELRIEISAKVYA